MVAVPNSPDSSAFPPPRPALFLDGSSAKGRGRRRPQRWPAAKQCSDAFRLYGKASKKHPLATAVITGMVISSAGDITCQKLQNPRQTLDKKRTVSQGVFQSLVACWLRMFFYPLLDRMLPGRALHVVLGKVSIEEGFNTPIWWGLGFNVYTGLLSGKNMNDTLEYVRTKYWGTMVMSWRLWIPAQTVTFALIPPHYRVLWVSSVNFVWSVLLSRARSTSFEVTKIAAQ